MIDIIRISLYEKRPKTLKVKFQFDRITLGKIKTIPEREYLYSEKAWLIPYRHIRRLCNMFDNSELLLDKNVDKNYVENNNYDFYKEISYLKDDRSKEFVRYIIQFAPKHFYTSSLSKTKSVIVVAHELSKIYELEDYRNDILIISAIIHDFFEYENENSKKTIFEHPLICTDTIEKNLNDSYDNLNDSIKYVYNMYWKEIAACVKSHHGKKNISYDGKIKLPLVKTQLQKLLYTSIKLTESKNINISDKEVNKNSRTNM